MRNESLNNTCILFDPKDEAQQKAIIKFYGDNGHYISKPFMWRDDDAICVYNGILNYWDSKAKNNQFGDFKVIELPSDYYPTTTSHFQLTENNGETKPYVVVDEKGDKGFVTPIVESESNNGWISVEDRLPEIDTDVLCYFQKWNRIDVCTYKNIFKLEFVENTICQTDYVTHWQPLPKSPTRK